MRADVKNMEPLDDFMAMISDPGIESLKQFHGLYTTENYYKAVRVSDRLEKKISSMADEADIEQIDICFVFGTLSDKIKVALKYIDANEVSLYIRANIFMSCCEGARPDLFCY